MLLVLLVWWQDLDKPSEPYQVIEFFAGVGRIAAVGKYMGYKTAAVDVEYGKDIPRKTNKKRKSRPPMDINGSAGLMLLGKMFVKCYVVCGMFSLQKFSAYVDLYCSVQNISVSG